MSRPPIEKLGFVVKDCKKTVEAWEKLFGVKGTVRVYDKEQVVLGVIEINGIRFVFNEPIPPKPGDTRPETQWAKFARESGEGLEHVCFSNFDYDQMIARAKSLGLRLLYDPYKDVEGKRANYVSKEDMCATKIEFMEIKHP